VRKIDGAMALLSAIFLLGEAPQLRGGDVMMWL
jgi:hypothetical protein